MSSNAENQIQTNDLKILQLFFPPVAWPLLLDVILSGIYEKITIFHVNYNHKLK